MESSLPKPIADFVQTLDGTVGIAVKHLNRNEGFSLNPDEQFASASVIKVPIIVELFNQVEEGRLKLSNIVKLREEDKVGGSGILDEMRPGMELSLRDLAALMIIVSDNDATNMLIDQVSTDAVNARMKALGLKGTILGRRLMDYEAMNRGFNNYCTAGDIALLLEKMHLGTAASPESCKEMLKIMRNQQFTDKLPLLLPPDIEVAAKGGWIPGVSHDSGIVYAPSGPIVMAIMTRGLGSRACESQAIARIARMAYDYFELS